METVQIWRVWANLPLTVRISAALMLFYVIALITCAAVQNGLETPQEKAAASVCLTGGYDNYHTLKRNKDGSFSVTCYNREWHTYTFEM